MKKRCISLILTICMIIVLFPVSVFAGDIEGPDNNGSDVILCSRNSLEIDEWDMDYAAVIKGAFDKIPKSAYSKVAKWSGVKLYEMFFPGNGKISTKEILQTLNELIEMGQQNLLALDELSEEVQDISMLRQINSYFNGNNNLNSAVKGFFGQLTYIEDQIPEEERDGEVLDVLIESMGKGATQPKGSSMEVLDQASDFDKQVIEFGEALTKDKIFLIDGFSTPLELMNDYCLSHFKWEHLGYEMREEYWTGMAALYLEAASLMKMSLSARIEKYEEENGEYTASYMRSLFNNLNDRIEEIQKLADDSFVEKRPDDQRYYQVPGHETLFLAKATKREYASLKNNASGRKDFPCEDGKKSNAYWEPFYIEKGTAGLSAEVYRNILSDYNPAGTAPENKVSLYDIFFNEGEGGFEKPEGIEEGCIFVTGDVKTYLDKKGSTWTYTVGDILLESETGNGLTWDASADFGKLRDGYSRMAVYVDGRDNIYHYIPAEYDDRYVMITPVAANEDPTVGTGMEVNVADGFLDIRTIAGYIASGLASIAPDMPTKTLVWTGTAFMNQMFDSMDAMDIMNAFDELNSIDQETLLKIEELKTLVKEEYYLEEINNYFNGNDCLQGLVSGYISQIEETQRSDRIEEVKEREMKSLFIQTMGAGAVHKDNDGQLVVENSLSDFDKMVLAFAEKLTTDKIFLVDGKNSTPLELMNDYSLSHYKWEHQAYDIREEYWTSLTGLFVESASLLKISLLARIESYKDYFGKEPTALIVAYNELMDYVEIMQDIGDKAAVKRRQDVRYYQVPGHEVLLSFKATKRDYASLKNSASGRKDFPCEDGKKSNAYWEPFYIENGSAGLSAEVYRNILSDYNSVGTTLENKMSLYDIFFNENEGAFEKPEGIEEGCIFVTGDVKTFLDKKGATWTYTVGDVLLESETGNGFIWNATGDFGELREGYSRMAVFIDGRDNRYHYIPAEYDDRYVMITMVLSNEDPTVGSGMVITELKEDFDNPPTNDGSDILRWVLFFVLSSAALIGTIFIYKKKS